MTVAFKGETATTTAGEDGKWMAELKELVASFEPAELVISEAGGKKEILADILVDGVAHRSNHQVFATHKLLQTESESLVDAPTLVQWMSPGRTDLKSEEDPGY